MAYNSYNNNNTWVSPVSGTVIVEVWGSGAGGGSNNRTLAADVSGGGGAGAYSSSNVTVTAGTSYPIVAPPGGAGGINNNNGANGATSSFNTTTVTALGGANGRSGATGGAGGTTGGTGTVKSAGGAGATGNASNGFGGGGGGAGASSGTGGAGTNPANAGGAGATDAYPATIRGGPAYNGSGGNGGSNNNNGNNGQEPGGGGGGAGNNTAGTASRHGGAGANGWVVIWYQWPPPVTRVYCTATTTSLRTSARNPHYVQPFPVVVAKFAPPDERLEISTTCVAVRTRRTSEQARFPRQGWVGGLVIRSNGTALGGAAKRLVGVWPPELVVIPPTQQQQTIKVATVAVSGRASYQRRQPRQGWTPSSVPATSGFVVATVGGNPPAPGVGSSAYLIGFDVADEGAATPFTGIGGALSYVQVQVATSGAPTDNLVCSILADAGGPSGAPLATASINGTTFASGANLQFPLSLSLDPTRTYWITLTRDGGNDSSNFYGWRKASDQQTGTTSVLNNGTWFAGGSGPPPAAYVGYLANALVSQAGQRSPLVGLRPPLLVTLPPTQQQQTIRTPFVSKAPALFVNRQRGPLRGVFGRLVTGQGASYVIDNFNRTNLGPNWLAFVELNGQLQILGNALSTAGSTPQYGYMNVAAWQDVEVSATTNTSAGSLTNPIGVIARAQPQAASGTGPSSVFYMGSLIVGGTWKLTSNVAGISTTIASGSTPVGLSNGDKIALRCIGSTIQFRYLPNGTTTWLTLGNVIDTAIPGPGYIGAQIGRNVLSLDDLTVTPLYPTNSPELNYLNNGPRPPVVITTSLPPVVPVSVQTTAVRTARFTSARFTRPTSFLGGPVVVVGKTIQYGPGVLTVRTRPRHTTTFLTPPATLATPQPPTPFISRTVQLRPRKTRSFLAPPTVVTTPTPVLQPITVVGRPTRPRHTRSFLAPPIFPTSTFVAPPTSVNTVTPDRIERRRFNSFLQPPVFYPATSTIRVTTVRARPRPTRHYLTQVVYQATSVIRVATVRTRPRPTSKYLSYVVYPQTGVIQTHVVRARPRPTRHFLTAVTYPQVTPITETEVAIKLAIDDRRRRAPKSRLAPPVFYAATSTIQTHLVRTRPRPTTHTGLTPLIFYAQTSEIQTALVRTRPRPTTKRLTAVFYPQVTPIAEDQVFVKTVVDDRRRRAPRSVLQPPVFYPATSTIRTTLVRARPRHTFNVVAPPSSLVVAQPPVVTTITVATVRTRPRHTTRALGPLIFYAATSDIQVTVTRTRPRPTHHLLTSISYPTVGVGFTHLVKTRPRPTTRATRGLIFYPATSVITVKTVRTRPRPTRHLLGALIFYPQTSVIRTTVIRTRPRPTRHFLTDVSYPQVTPIFEHEVFVKTVVDDRRRRQPRSHLSPPVFYAQTSTIRVTTVRTRPRPTTHFLTATRYAQTSTIRAATVRTRPRRTHWFLTDVVYAQATPIVESEIAVKTVGDDRRRRQPTSQLNPPVFYPQTSTISVTLVATRPRPTTRFLTAVTYPATSTITVATVRTRPRPTTKFVTSVSYPQTSTITVTVVRTRPRPTHHALTEVTYPQVTPIAETNIAVKTVVDDRRRRGTHSQVFPPKFYKATSAIRVTVVRTRPRKPTSVLVVPSTLVIAQKPVVTTVAIHLTHTRPRPTTHFLRPFIFRAQTSTIHVATVRTRPRPTRAFFTKFVTYPQKTTIHVAVVRTRPRPTRHFLTAVRYSATSTIKVTVVRTRPRPTTRFLTHVRYAPVGQTQVTLTHTRPRPTTRFLAFVQGTEPPVVTTIATHLTRTRPRPTTHALAPPTLAQAGQIRVVLVTTRPRPTRGVLARPTVIHGAVVFRPVQVTLVHTRPRPTTRELHPPEVVVTSVCGFTDGYTIGAAGGSAEDAPAASGSAEDIAAGAGSAESVAESASTIQAVPEAAAEATTERCPII